MLGERSRDNCAGYKKISGVDNKINKGLDQVAADNGQNMRVQNIDSMFHQIFTDLEEITNYRDFCESVDFAEYAEFSPKITAQGVFFSGNKILHNLSCAENSEVEIEVSIQVTGNALEQMSK